MIDDLAEFLAHAVRLEANAAAAHVRLADRMDAEDNPEVAALFRKLGELSRIHLAETQERYRHIVGDHVPLPEQSYHWPDGDSPENPPATMSDHCIDTRKAIEMALRLEREACDFYSAVANQTRNAEVQELAQTFTEEEAEHVSHLERWLERLERSGLRGVD